ncbi:MAG: hypothetical protein KDC14_16980, partial [Planctomycetes bacterium]|nr:hypothetical protein [Planctomycetota bacterium]
SGDPEVPRGQVQQDLEQLRRLIAGLIGSVGQAGQQIAQEYERKYSPMAIETLVPPSKWGRKEKLWDKYCELAPDVREREREIYQCIATFAESLIKGLGR